MIQLIGDVLPTIPLFIGSLIFLTLIAVQISINIPTDRPDGETHPEGSHSRIRGERNAAETGGAGRGDKWIGQM